MLGRFVLGGTHRGPFEGIPPTWAEIEVTDHASVRFADGRIAVWCAGWDIAGLLDQLVAIGSPVHGG